VAGETRKPKSAPRKKKAVASPAADPSPSAPIPKRFRNL